MDLIGSYIFVIDFIGSSYAFLRFNSARCNKGFFSVSGGFFKFRTGILLGVISMKNL